MSIHGATNILFLKTLFVAVFVAVLIKARLFPLQSGFPGCSGGKQGETGGFSLPLQPLQTATNGVCSGLRSLYPLLLQTLQPPLGGVAFCSG